MAAAHSFTDTGRELGLSHSSASDHIRRLEQSVNRRLFVRDPHSLKGKRPGRSGQSFSVSSSFQRQFGPPG